MISGTGSTKNAQPQPGDRTNVSGNLAGQANNNPYADRTFRRNSRAQIRGARTTAEYLTTLNLWAEITGDPVIDAITDNTIHKFTVALLRRPGKSGGTTSPNTVRKHLRQLKAMLRAVGPKSVGGTGRLTDLPHITMPNQRHTARETWTLENLKSLAERPPEIPEPLTAPVPPTLWWKALIVILYNTAWRIGTALALRWEWLHGDWAYIPAEALKGKRSSRKFYLNRHAKTALQSIRQNADPRALPWNGAEITLHRYRVKLQKQLGLPWDFRHGFHCIRRSALSAIARINPLVARIVAGHSSGDVLAEHYIADDVIAHVLEKLPQPW